MSEDEQPIRYIERTRSYYQALGYGAPYRWAHFEDVPFHRLEKPLSDCTVALLTTAAPFQAGQGDQGPGAPYNAAAKFYEVYSAPSDAMPDLRISHIAIDRDHTTAEDMGSYFPLLALRRAFERGRVGAIAPRFHGVPTNRSQRATIETDAPELARRCKNDRTDAALLVANCPVCHQSVTLAARALEAAGIATVVMGCALDIVEHVGAPRLLFSDFPLGNAAGRPGDIASQDATLELAFELLEAAQTPRATLRSPLSWIGAPDWKKSYCNIANLSAGEIARRRAAFDEGRKIAGALRKGDRTTNE